MFGYFLRSVTSWRHLANMKRVRAQRAAPRQLLQAYHNGSGTGHDTTTTTGGRKLPEFVSSDDFGLFLVTILLSQHRGSLYHTH